jgi:hypothetical protein
MFRMAALAFLLAAPAHAQRADPESIQTQIAETARDYDLGEQQTFLVGKRLRDDAEYSLKLPVESGQTYLITAACDEDCDGLNLEARDAAAYAIDEDRGAMPVLLFKPQKAGQITVVIEMRGCANDAGCAYGLGFFPLKSDRKPAQPAN